MNDDDWFTWCISGNPARPWPGDLLIVIFMMWCSCAIDIPIVVYLSGVWLLFVFLLSWAGASVCCDHMVAHLVLMLLSLHAPSR